MFVERVSRDGKRETKLKYSLLILLHICMSARCTHRIDIAEQRYIYIFSILILQLRVNCRFNIVAYSHFASHIPPSHIPYVDEFVMSVCHVTGI